MTYNTLQTLRNTDYIRTWSPHSSRKALNAALLFHQAHMDWQEATDRLLQARQHQTKALSDFLPDGPDNRSEEERATLGKAAKQAMTTYRLARNHAMQTARASSKAKEVFHLIMDAMQSQEVSP